MKIPGIEHLQHLGDLPEMMNDMDHRLMAIEEALSEDIVGVLSDILIELRKANEVAQGATLY